MIPSQTSVILAAGGILTRSGEREIMIVHRHRHNDWSLPKGKLDPGESFEQAALREVREETGCIAELADFAGACAYIAKGRPKVVLFWRMSLIEQHPIEPGEEIAEALWLPVEEAIQRLTYTCERDLVWRALQRAGGDFSGRAEPTSN